MNFGIILSQNVTPVFKYIVWVLGKIMEGIFFVLDKVGIPNIGLSIIFFTIIVNLCMLPLTYKQQKFSKLSQKMQPEIKAIQKKYEGKKDQDSQMAMSNEMQEVYGKYGVSPTGSCLYLLIQMPILFALYRVIYQMPGYVAKIKLAFTGSGLIDGIASDPEAIELVKSFKNSGMFAKQWENAKFTVENTIIDCLNRASSTDWDSLKAFGDGKFANAANNTLELFTKYNNFLGLNIGDTPWYTMKTGFTTGHIWMGIGALLIPILAGVTQWINVKLSPQQPQSDDAGNQMAASMKTMNYIMPLMSVWFCFTLPAGMGLYWIAGAVVRGFIMVILNKKIDKMDYEKLIASNAKKNAKKIAKRKATQEKLNAYASMNTRNISGNSNNSSKNNSSNKSSNTTSSYVRRNSDIAKKASNVSDKESPKSSGSSGGSMMAKANAVKNFNEKNNK